MSFILADIEGLSLTSNDCELLKHPSIAGIVLFARNYADPDQLTELISAVKRIKPNMAVAVDQEGGRVQRFKKAFTTLPCQAYWGERFEADSVATTKQLTQTIHIMAGELQAVGVNFNLVPVLDIKHDNSSVIAERSFAVNPEIVADLANILIDTLHESGFPVIGKHFPGHGCVVGDSHHVLPSSNTSLATLTKNDLVPFVKLLSKLDALMPAHVIFEQIDEQPVTFSKWWLRDYLREQLGYKGVVISDDLTMTAAAIAGGYPERATAALTAGCDLLTVCNNRAGVEAILDASITVSDEASQQRVEQFLSRLH